MEHPIKRLLLLLNYQAAPKPALGAHLLQIAVACVRQRIVGRVGKRPKREGGRGRG